MQNKCKFHNSRLWGQLAPSQQQQLLKNSEFFLKKLKYVLNESKNMINLLKLNFNAN